MLVVKLMNTLAATAENRRPEKSAAGRRRSGGSLRRMFWMRWCGVALLLACAGWFTWVYRQIVATAELDNARPADAIAVFGAAEYAGRPSPVLRARLDKAVSLYDEGMAPLIITLGGGAEKDSGRTEGGVGRDYLLANGVPYDKIIAETKSLDTEQQVKSLAGIAAQRHLRHLIVVSDGTHLFRIALLCKRAGLRIYTSPRDPLGHIDRVDAAKRMAHEMLSYTFERMGMNVSRLRLWLDGRAEES
ncbi:MAG: YdcF family protein [Acidobacteriaceae bacterium]